MDNDVPSSNGTLRPRINARRKSSTLSTLSMLGSWQQPLAEVKSDASDATWEWNLEGSKFETHKLLGPSYSFLKNPITPIAIPGAWNQWENLPAMDDDDWFALPPPFLDKNLPKESFLEPPSFTEKENRRLQRQHEVLPIHKNRPQPAPPFPLNLLSLASKIISALGPPGGVDSGPLYGSWVRKRDVEVGKVSVASSDEYFRYRRLRRAEIGILGYEMMEAVLVYVTRQVHSSFMCILSLSPPLHRAYKSSYLHATRVDWYSDITPKIEHIPETFNNSAATPLSMFGDTFDIPKHEPSVDILNNRVTPDLKPLDSLSPLHISRVYQVTGGDTVIPPISPLVLEQDRPASLSKSTIRDRLTSEVPEFSTALDEASTMSSASLNASDETSPIKILRYLLFPCHAFFLCVGWTLLGQFYFTLGKETRSNRRSLIFVGGALGLLLYILGFLFFITTHSVSLCFSFLEAIRSVALFLYWIYLNLTLQTELSIVAWQYICLCRVEWEQVCNTDTERLSLSQFFLSFLELGTLHAMTRKSFLDDGPGQLAVLQRSDVDRHSHIGNDGENLIITGGEGTNVLEATIISGSAKPRRQANEQTEDTNIERQRRGDGLLPFSTSCEARSPYTHSFKREKSPPLYPLPEPEPVKVLISDLKRYARLATASYGLHSYILSSETSDHPRVSLSQSLPGSPSFLSHYIFSHLGGIERHNVLHVAIQKQYSGVHCTDESRNYILKTEGLPTTRDVQGDINPTVTTHITGRSRTSKEEDELEEAYSPQFYLLRDDTHAETVCVFRGTQSLADISTDLKANLAQITLGGGTYYVHSGILACVKRLLQPDKSELYKKLYASMEEMAGYTLVFTGHSLGAAIASLMALICAELSSDNKWVTNASCGLIPGRRVKAVCFAHPVVMDNALAQRASLGDTPLVFSISYASDLVCRLGLPQISEFRRVLGRLQLLRRRLTAEARKRPDAPWIWSPVIQTWWRWKKLKSVKESITASTKDINEEINYIKAETSKWRNQIDGYIPAKEHQARRALGSNPSVLAPPGRVLHIDQNEEGDYFLYHVKDPKAFYACPLMEADMVRNHLPRFYLDAIEAF